MLWFFYAYTQTYVLAYSTHYETKTVNPFLIKTIKTYDAYGKMK